MAQFFVFVLGTLIIGLIGNYLTWGPMTSREMVLLFGPVIGIEDRDNINNRAFLERRRKQGLASERARLITLVIICSVGLIFFSPDQFFPRLLQNHTFWRIFFLISIVIVIWCSYLGPRTFSVQDSGRFHYFSKDSFHKYVKPYLAWLPYGIAIWGGLALASLYLVIYNLSADYLTIEQAFDNVNQVVIRNSNELQYASFYLVKLGRFLSVIIQKYWIATLLAFLYVLLEQRSNMRYTVRTESVELMKIAVWVVFLATMAISLTYLPYRYGAIQTELLLISEQMVTVQTNDEELAQIIELQQYIEEHSIEWLVFRVIRGHGNIITLAIVGLSLLFWRAFFKDVSFTSFLRVLLPQAVLKMLNEFAGNLELDLKIDKKSKS